MTLPCADAAAIVRLTLCTPGGKVLYSDTLIGNSRQLKSHGFIHLARSQLRSVQGWAYVMGENSLKVRNVTKTMALAAARR